MKTLLLLTILLVYWQTGATKVVDLDSRTDSNYLVFQKRNIITTIEDRNPRALADIWTQIKNKVTEAWNFVKDLANKGIEKINIWKENAKKRIEEAKKIFEANLQALKDRINDIIKKVLNVGDKVKHCVKEDGENIKNILKQIADEALVCYNANSKKLSLVENYQTKLILNDTKFTNEAENKIGKCLQNIDDDTEDCLNNARREIYDGLDHTETDIIRKTKSEARELIDDLIDKAIDCIANGILKASDQITNEVTKIIQCVKSEIV